MSSKAPRLKGGNSQKTAGGKYSEKTSHAEIIAYQRTMVWVQEEQYKNHPEEQEGKCDKEITGKALIRTSQS